MAKLEKKNGDRAAALETSWSGRRWRDVTRSYGAGDVLRLRGSLRVEHTIARHGAERLWSQLQDEPFVRTFGVYTGAQAVQAVRAGMQALYVSGWQVAGDANLSGHTYPDQSLYPSNSVPAIVERLNSALQRADQIEVVESGKASRDWLVPIVADAEAGFGGPLHAFELMRSMIAAGAAGVHFEDQLAAEKKCGHLGGKVLVPTSQFERVLTAARLAADVSDVPTLLIARTDANAATLLTSDVDPRDQEHLTGERTPEGYHTVRPGLDAAIARGLSYAPLADMVWCETSRPDVEEARRFADAIRSEYPSRMLAYNCSPSFNWSRNLDAGTIATFQRELAAMGYKFQFITLAGWHLTNLRTFEFAKGYADAGMSAYVEVQDREFELAPEYTAAKHQREVGAGYFDELLKTITGGEAATAALAGSTETEQF